MTTMKEQRIVEILGELSDRVAHLSYYLSELREEFTYRRRPNMQIRKDAQRTIESGLIYIKRLISIAKANGYEGTSLYETFLSIENKFSTRASFFFA